MASATISAEVNHSTKPIFDRFNLSPNDIIYRAGRQRDMGQYRIVCATPHIFHHPHPHSHIVRIGTGLPQKVERMWSMAEVYAAMETGDKFFTADDVGTKVAPIMKLQCHLCNTASICSSPATPKDIDLERLPPCKLP